MSGAIPPWGDPLSFLLGLNPFYPLASCELLLFVVFKKFSVTRKRLKKIDEKSVTYVGELSVTHVTDWTREKRRKGAPKNASFLGEERRDRKSVV